MLSAAEETGSLSINAADKAFILLKVKQFTSFVGNFQINNETVMSWTSWPVLVIKNSNEILILCVRGRWFPYIYAELRYVLHTFCVFNSFSLGQGPLKKTIAAFL